MRPMFKRCGFKELYFEDNEARYQFLLEKVPLNEIDPEFSGSGRRKKSMVDQLAKRLEIGREYALVQSSKISQHPTPRANLEEK